jgi:geranylgeranyl reductase family protein
VSKRGANQFDVIVVGGGPAGAMMGWKLARDGVRVAVLERSVFPREKVCGDFVEPSGLRLMRAMGCDAALDGPDRLPITDNRVYFGPHMVCQGRIPYYDGANSQPDHALIIPRSELDAMLLQRAADVGATVMMGCAAGAVRSGGGGCEVDMRQGGAMRTLTAPLVVGADGFESLVGRSAGLERRDRRHIGVARRVYLENVDVNAGETTIWFDEDHIPGYGWMFPMPGGRANFGVGVLSESAERFGLSVPKIFEESLGRLRIRHPGCAGARIVSKPLGGVVKAYGGIDRNHFDGGLLIGDAGSFVDPITGEGITQGMESAVIASRTLAAALAAGRFDAAFLARYDNDFRAYFDPTMLYVGFCAVIMRNWHFRELVWRVTRRGFERAHQDAEFGRIAGAGFGGVDVRPRAIIVKLWMAIFGQLARGGVDAVTALLSGKGAGGSARDLVGDLSAWERGWRASVADDAAWHYAWLADAARALARMGPALAADENPRLRGVEI